MKIMASIPTSSPSVLNLRIIPYHKFDPAFNMAADELLFSQGKPALRFYGWSPSSVSFGKFNKKFNDIDMDFCRKEGIGLVIRKTGGKTVFHDAELTYSIVLPSSIFPRGVLETYREISAVIASALAKCNVATEMESNKNTDESSVCFREVSSYEITASGKKLVGSAQHRNSRTVLQHGSILLKADWSKMSRIWRGAFSEQQLKQRITCLEDEKSTIGSAEELAVAISSSATEAWNSILEHRDFTAEEIAQIKSLAPKYAAPLS